MLKEAPPLVKRSRKRFRQVLCRLAMAICFAASLSQAMAQTVVFSDDFSSNEVDASKYEAAVPFFEGGTGDIHAEAGDGVMRFVGSTTQQWWSGGTLKIKETFSATPDTPVTISIDRVAENGQGSASRSALWIFDETETNYVLFADVRGEGGWRWNRKIGQDGDAPTGGGNNVTDFDDAALDDGGLHQMSLVADGETVKILLDGVQGAETSFPFNNVIFHFGSFARADNDTADTTWDNLQVQTVIGTSVVFSDDFSSNEIDAAKYESAVPFFEGGEGDIHAEAGDGVMRFVGTTTQQWWSGGTLKINQAFGAAPDSPVTLSIDRVAEAGQGSASRSALWVFDESETNYVLFADVRGEGGWRYNRKIGQDGDVPTGGGNNMATFDGEPFDDGAEHTMTVVADGQTVKLILDGIEGADVAFPFSPVIFHFGAFARADNDTADTTWDNLSVQAVPQQSNVVFSDDFESNSIDSAKYQAAEPFFEGGEGDIHAEAADGAIRFVGTTTQQWWSGGTLRVVPTFAPSDSEKITLAIDRVAEAGVGSASRSALWIYDETETNYILFADVRGEGGWRYNRKIGQDGDVPTGGGNNMAIFDGEPFDDGGLHTMSMVADGSTVKLILDGIEGADVSFPFSPVIFHFGSFARADNDTADTTWDNLSIVSEGGATFSPSGVGLRQGGVSQPVTVRIPQGLNSQKAINVTVTSDDPSVATPEGGTGGSISLSFPAGGANTTTFRIAGNSIGGTQFTLSSGDVASGNRLDVAVVDDPGVRLEEDFAGNSIDTSKWGTSDEGFGNGTGSFTVAQDGGQLKIGGFVDEDTWPGASLKTKDSFLATADLNLVFEVDRVAIDQFGSAARTGVFITNDDRSRYVFFSQQLEDNDNAFWRVNTNPGSATGGGTVINGFGPMQDLDNHRMKLIADGSRVEVFLDGVSGGSFPFEVSAGIFFEIGSYAQFLDEDVAGTFDNVFVENVLPCIKPDTSSVLLTLAESQDATVTIPSLVNDSADAVVTVTSSDPSVAVPAGAVDGVLTLTFEAGSSNARTFAVLPVGIGTAQFEIATSADACIEGSIKVDIISVPEVFVTDNFGGDSFDSAIWKTDETSFNDSGVIKADPDSAVSIVDGQLLIHVEVEQPVWPGLGLFSVDSFSATAAEPLTFEIDRKSVDFVLAAGVSSESRTGIWVKSGDNYVFFVDHTTHDARNFGWRYNRMPGEDDNEETGDGINIPSFDGGAFDNRGDHRLKMVLNGSTVKLFLDDVFGTEVDFPFADNLSFGFGSYADDVGPPTEEGEIRGNQTSGFFDNARILGGSVPFEPPPVVVPPVVLPPVPGGGGDASISGISVSGDNLVIEWSGSSLMESATVDGTYSPIDGATPPSTSVPIGDGNKFIIAQ
ncbi:hypothetical protein N9B57_01285 [Verrucomicrobia bacterium]|nr:hypothetical protein [Verrucomicrobiota bacterium]